MKVIHATILDPTHLELLEPLSTRPGAEIQISIPDEDDHLENDWKKISEKNFLKAYSDQDSIYDQL
jgi:hypothetical protein